MKRLLVLSAVLIATILMGSSAHAGGFRFGWGSGYNNYGGGYSHGGYGRSYSRNFGSRFNHGYGGHFGAYPSFGYGRSYHDTSHYDYHPPTVTRHRNHLHYTPGHYDFHQTGHHH